MVKNVYNHPSIPFQNQKGKETLKLINIHERYSRLTEWTALSQTCSHSAALTKNSSNIGLFLPIVYFELQNIKQHNRKLNSGDHIAHRVLGNDWSKNGHPCAKQLNFVRIPISVDGG